MLKEAYKVGFLHRLAEHGMAPSDVERYLQTRKQAAEVLQKQASWPMVEGLSTLALLGMIAAPAVGGTLTGKLHGTLVSEPPGTTKRMMQAQRLQMLRDQADKLRNEVERMRAKKRKQSIQPTLGEEEEEETTLIA